MSNQQSGATPIRDFTALKEQHPEAYRAWVAEGVAQERERIRSHLKMAGLCPSGTVGAGLKIALEAIQRDTPMDATAVEKYTAAALNQRDIDARHADEQVLAEAADGVGRTTGPQDFADRVATKFEQLTGVRHA